MFLTVLITTSHPPKGPCSQELSGNRKKNYSFSILSMKTRIMTKEIRWVKCDGQTSLEFMLDTGPDLFPEDCFKLVRHGQSGPEFPVACFKWQCSQHIPWIWPISGLLVLPSRAKVVSDSHSFWVLPHFFLGLLTCWFCNPNNTIVNRCPKTGVELT